MRGRLLKPEVLLLERAAADEAEAADEAVVAAEATACATGDDAVVVVAAPLVVADAWSVVAGGGSGAGVADAPRAVASTVSSPVVPAVHTDMTTARAPGPRPAAAATRCAQMTCTRL